MYMFGAFLIFTAVAPDARRRRGAAPGAEPGAPAVPALRAHRPREYVGSSFFVRQDGKLYATPLLMVLVVIEATDVVFAVDSIPAVFGVTTRRVHRLHLEHLRGAGLARALLPGREHRAHACTTCGRRSALRARVRRRQDADRRTRSRIPNWVSLLVIAGLIAARRCCRADRQTACHVAASNEAASSRALRLSKPAGGSGRAGRRRAPCPGTRSRAARARSPPGRRTRR